MRLNDLETEHLRIREDTINNFKTTLGNYRVLLVDVYFNALELEITELYDIYRSRALHLDAKSKAINHYRVEMDKVTGW
jgi:hypothetical protein